MRAVVQRVTSAELRVKRDGEWARFASIGQGLVVFGGLEAPDEPRDIEWMASKIANLRIFEDEAGKMNLSLLDLVAAGAEPGLMLVSNFTVAGNAQKGRRPDFFNAMKPPTASLVFDDFVRLCHRLAPGVIVVSGVFGAEMHVLVGNDGPVTIWLDSRA
ncbi:MAG: D-tyrosyl-tRNA(Tyr) deacylase [Phycisphaerales bacterium]|nr:D-tyrosyl-tRNA(Tyr) deacylase [Phycisphaerales bacterium]